MEAEEQEVKFTLPQSSLFISRVGTIVFVGLALVIFVASFVGLL